MEDGKRAFGYGFAKELGVTEDMEINWKVSGVRPNKEHMEKLTEFVPGKVFCFEDAGV